MELLLTAGIGFSYDVAMSDESGVFFKLARDLSAEERTDLLQRLSARVGETPEPLLVSDSDEQAHTSVDEYHSRMGLLKRIILFLKAMVTQRDIHELVEEEMVSHLARDLAQRNPDLYYPKTGSLGPGLFRSLESLNQSLTPVSDALRYAVGSHRRDFVARLASILLPLEHEKLVKASTPEEYDDTEQADEFEFRKRVQMATRDALSGIDREARGYLYAMYRSVFFLSELAVHPLLKAGRIDVGETGVTALQYRRELAELGDIVASIGLRPSKAAIEAVARFFLESHDSNADTEDRNESPDSLEEDESEHRVESLSNRGNEAVRELQQFVQSVPIVEIVRVLERNPAYTPDMLGGGEDWYSQYRQYWEERAERNLARSMRFKKLAEFKTQSKTLFGGDSRSLDAYRGDVGGELYRVGYPETARFLLQFAEVYFAKKLARLLKTFLVNGEFYKSQNREELTDAYNGLAALADAVWAIDRSLGSEGEIGRVIAHIRGEPVPMAVRKKRAAEVIARLDTSMDQLIHQTMHSLDSLSKTMKGMLFGESGGAYDTLINIRAIGGAENKSLLKRLDQGLSELESVKRLLHQIYDLEHSSG